MRHALRTAGAESSDRRVPPSRNDKLNCGNRSDRAMEKLRRGFDYKPSVRVSLKLTKQLHLDLLSIDYKQNEMCGDYQKVITGTLYKSVLVLDE